MTLKYKFTVIEESETAKINFYTWKKAIRYMCEEDSTIIWWRSPGFNTSSRPEDKITFGPDYASDYKSNSRGRYIIRNIVNSWREHEYKLKITKCIEDFVGFLKDIDEISLLHQYSYKGFSIGRYLASDHLRFIPSSIITGELNKNYLIQVAYSIYSDILLADKLMKYLEAPILFFTERVYRGGALQEYLNSKGGVSFDFDLHPLLITKTDIKSDYISASPIYQSLQKKFQSICAECSHNEIRKKFVSEGTMRLKGLIFHNENANIGQSDENNANVDKLFGSCGIETIKTIDLDTRMRDLCVSSKIFIFYLHCFTDGPYYEGFSGFRSPFQYFQEVIKAISIYSRKMCDSDKPLVLIKLHPNLLLGSVTGFRHDLEKLQWDVEITRELLMFIKTIYNRVYLLETSVSLRNLSELENIYIVTHHGSIGYESLALGMRTLCSSTAPYSGLGFGEYPICYRDDFQRQFDDFVKSRQTVPETLTDQKLIFAALMNFMPNIHPHKLMCTFMGCDRPTLYKRLIENPLLPEELLSEEELILLDKLHHKLFRLTI